MPSLSIAALFSDPDVGRLTLIDHIQAFTTPPPARGSSFFIHLSELCPVACKHCMYSSTLTPKTLKDALNKDDLVNAIAFISDSRSAKLNITGGGEPFLKFAHILRLVAAVDVPVIEIVTAGHWAQTVGRATSVIAQLDEARRANGKLQELRLRLSLDRYHTEAPRPVTLDHYANVARAWLMSDRGVGLGYRSIEPDQGIIDTQLADILGAKIRIVDSWNHLIELDKDVAIPITFNVMRFSGNAADPDERNALSQATRSIKDYYKQSQD